MLILKLRLPIHIGTPSRIFWLNFASTRTKKSLGLNIYNASYLDKSYLRISIELYEDLTCIFEINEKQRFFIRFGSIVSFQFKNYLLYC